MPDPLAAMADVSLSDVPDVVLRLLLEAGDTHGVDSLIALLRSTGHEEARDTLRNQLERDFTSDFSRRLSGPDAPLRAELLAAWILGIGVLRSVIGTPALRDADLEAIRAPFGDGVAALLRSETTPGSERDEAHTDTK